MGKKKKLELKIEDRLRFIDKHKNKISKERLKPIPDEGLIRHWQSEIRGAKKAIANYQRRLQALGWTI